MISHSVICWSATALWADPVDILRVVLDITCLAVNAVLGVDHKPLTILTILSGDVLVDT